MTLPELIAALEKLEGPSREMDCRIACHLAGWTIIDEPGQRERWEQGSGAAWMTESRTSGCTNFSAVPEYTKSVDEALTLARNDDEHFDMLKAYVTHGRNTGSKTKGLCRAIADNLQARLSSTENT